MCEKRIAHRTKIAKIEHIAFSRPFKVSLQYLHTYWNKTDVSIAEILDSWNLKIENMARKILRAQNKFYKSYYSFIET